MVCMVVLRRREGFYLGKNRIRFHLRAAAALKARQMQAKIIQT